MDTSPEVTWYVIALVCGQRLDQWYWILSRIKIPDQVGMAEWLDLQE